MVTYNMDNAQDLGGIDLFVNNLYTGVTSNGQVTAKNIPGNLVGNSSVTSILGTNNTWAGNQTFNNKITLSPQINTVTKGLVLNQTIAGTAVGQFAYNAITIAADTLAGQQGAVNTPLEVQFSFGGGATTTGNRAGININGTLTAPCVDSVQGGGAYTALSGQMVGNSDCGGSGLTQILAKGNCTGANLIGTLGPAATNMNGVQAAEFNVNAQSGCSMVNKLGIAIINLSNSKTQGSVEDAAISIVNQPGAGVAPWTSGVAIGRHDGQWPFSATSSFVTTSGTSIGSLQYGIDFTGITVPTGGAMFLAPFITPATSTSAGKTGSMCWDTSFIYICTAPSTWKRVAASTW